MRNDVQSSKRLSGMVVLYLLCVMALVGVIGVGLIDTTDTHLTASKTQVYRQLARYCADSGLEYAVAMLNRELPRDPGPYQDTDPGNIESPYTPGPGIKAWLQESAAGEVPGSEFMLGPIEWTQNPAIIGVGEEIAARYRMAFALAMRPSFNYANVRQQMDAGFVPQFTIRSRGIVRGELDPIARPSAPNARILLGHSEIVLTVRVRVKQFKSNPAFVFADCIQPIIERVCYDLDPNPAVAMPPYTDH